MQVDLHSHSHASDGTYAPIEVVQLAKTAGVQVLALTDHDTLAGYLSVRDTVHDSMQDIVLVAGVEISCRHRIQGGYGKNPAIDKTIHIVGLDIQEPKQLENLLQKTQNSRAERAMQIVQKLSQIVSVAFDVLWQHCLQKVAHEKFLGRAHIAQALVELHVVNSIQEAFDKYLADGKAAYVAIQSMDLAQAISCIHACGGFAVLAHPTRYRLSATQTRRLIEDCALLGVDACELPHVSEPISTRQMIDRQIALHNLCVSVGSDFHGSTMPWRKLGVVAKPHANQIGIWQKFRTPLDGRH